MSPKKTFKFQVIFWGSFFSLVIDRASSSVILTADKLPGASGDDFSGIDIDRSMEEQTYIDVRLSGKIKVENIGCEKDRIKKRRVTRRLKNITLPLQDNNPSQTTGENGCAQWKLSKSYTIKDMERQLLQVVVCNEELCGTRCTDGYRFGEIYVNITQQIKYNDKNS